MLAKNARYIYVFIFRNGVLPRLYKFILNTKIYDTSGTFNGFGMVKSNYMPPYSVQNENPYRIVGRKRPRHRITRN